MRQNNENNKCFKQHLIKNEKKTTFENKIKEKTKFEMKMKKKNRFRKPSTHGMLEGVTSLELFQFFLVKSS